MKNPNLPSKVSIISIGVKNAAKSLEFYSGTLELPVTMQAPGLAMVSGSSVTLMLNEALGKLIPPGGESMEVVFAVDSVSASHQALTEKGCEFFRLPREVTPGSYAATFKDPDGHLLTVFGGK